MRQTLKSSLLSVGQFGSKHNQSCYSTGPSIATPAAIPARSSQIPQCNHVGDVAIACPNSVISLIPWQNPPVGISLQLVDNKNAVSIFTTESAATPISRDYYPFPMNTQDA